MIRVEKGCSTVMLKYVEKVNFHKDKYIVITAFLCALISGIAFMYFAVANGGALVLKDDFNVQMIPYTAAAHDMLHNYTGQWSWNLDLGSQGIGGYGFYTLGSPLFYLTLLFDKAVLPYVFAPLFTVKYTCAGIFAYMYICYFVKDRRYAVVAAIMYAFCGLQNYNLLFGCFHDSVAVFPLLLIAMEEFMAGRSKIKLSLAVGLCAFVHYYCFIADAVFLVIYFLIRWAGIIEPKELINRIFSAVAYAVLGIGLSAVLLLPSLLALMGNPRVGGGGIQILYSFQELLLILKGMLSPVDNMVEQFAISETSWSSISCYLPMFGMALPIAYVFRKKDRLSLLFLVLTVMSFIPILNSVFSGLTGVDYKRWWYAYVLIMVLMSAIVLEKKEEFKINTCLVINAVFFVAFIIAVVMGRRLGFLNEGIRRRDVLLMNVVVVVVSLLIAIIVSNLKKHREMLTIIAVSVFAFVELFSTIALFKVDNSGDSYMDNYKLALYNENLTTDQQYRFLNRSNLDTMVSNQAGVYAFSSTIVPQLFEFYDVFDYYRSNSSPDITAYTGLREFLGAKYQLAGGSSNAAASTDSFDMNGRTWYLLEENVCPIGYKVDTYITEDELRQLPADERAVAMINHYIVSDENMTEVPGAEKAADILANKNQLKEYVNVAVSNKVLNFRRDNSGFTCDTAYDTDGVLLFTVPKAYGWRAYVDGSSAEILNNKGLMALAVDAGNHSIRFVYETPGLKAGLVMTILSFAIVMLLVLIPKIKQNKVK